jgi:hypothetical protein
VGERDLKERENAARLLSNDVRDTLNLKCELETVADWIFSCSVSAGIRGPKEESHYLSLDSRGSRLYLVFTLPATI